MEIVSQVMSGLANLPNLAKKRNPHKNTRNRGQNNKCRDDVDQNKM